MPSIFYPSPRVSQLDARILDNELFSLLKQQLADAFALLSSKPWSFDLHPELWSLALKLVIFRLTTFKTGSSYGNKLQNLKLLDSRTGALVSRSTRMLLLGTIVGEYVLDKCQSYLYDFEANQEQARRAVGARITALVARYNASILKVSKDAFKVVQLLNTVLFIVYGRFPSLVHRALGVSVTPVVADLLKFNGTKVNFEFQNRQLVWNVMTEFLVFILPLLQLHRWRRFARSVVSKKAASHESTPQYTDLPVSQCALCIEMVEKSGMKGCATQVTNPCVTNCGHIFCYVCLTRRLNAIENGNDSAEACPRCRQKLQFFRVYGKDPEDVDADAIVVETTRDDEDDKPEYGEDDKSEYGQGKPESSQDDQPESGDPGSGVELHSSDESDATSVSDLDVFEDNEDLEELLDI